MINLDVSQLSGTPVTRTYCVQYRESDFNFVCRLLEEEGIYFYFKHTASGHSTQGMRTGEFTARRWASVPVKNEPTSANFTVAMDAAAECPMSSSNGTPIVTPPPTVTATPPTTSPISDDGNQYERGARRNAPVVAAGYVRCNGVRHCCHSNSDNIGWRILVLHAQRKRVHDAGHQSVCGHLQARLIRK